MHLAHKNALYLVVIMLSCLVFNAQEVFLFIPIVLTIDIVKDSQYYFDCEMPSRLIKNKLDKFILI